MSKVSRLDHFDSSACIRKGVLTSGKSNKNVDMLFQDSYIQRTSRYELTFSSESIMHSRGAEEAIPLYQRILSSSIYQKAARITYTRHHYTSTIQRSKGTVHWKCYEMIRKEQRNDSSLRDEGSFTKDYSFLFDDLIADGHLDSRRFVKLRDDHQYPPRGKQFIGTRRRRTW